METACIFACTPPVYTYSISISFLGSCFCNTIRTLLHVHAANLSLHCYHSKAAWGMSSLENPSLISRCFSLRFVYLNMHFCTQQTAKRINSDLRASFKVPSQEFNIVANSQTELLYASFLIAHPKESVNHISLEKSRLRFQYAKSPTMHNYFGQYQTSQINNANLSANTIFCDS